MFIPTAPTANFGLIDRFAERKNGPRNLPEGRIGGAAVEVSEGDPYPKSENINAKYLQLQIICIMFAPEKEAKR